LSASLVGLDLEWNKIHVHPLAKANAKAKAKANALCLNTTLKSLNLAGKCMEREG
jgi:hypothetical protein